MQQLVRKQSIFDFSFAGKETLRETFKKSNIQDRLKTLQQNFLRNIAENETSVRVFHGRLSSSEADKLLTGNQSGTFILRKSERLQDSIVVSFINGKKIYHCPIETHENGTFTFRDNVIVDGDDLIAFLQKNGKTIFQVDLNNPLKGSALPEHLWKRGYTTILHKVVTEGSMENLEFLLSNDHCPPIDLKNEEGNTALHMACYIGRDDMVELLLKHQAMPALLNMHGWTPLQMATIGNNPSTISVMIETGNVAIDERNTLNLFSALHCAAACNNVESLKTLLDYGANPLALNEDGNTPAQIARSHKSDDCTRELDGRIVKSPNSQKSEWFHGELTKQQQSQIESNSNTMNGAFYVRKSATQPNNYTACLRWNGKWLHSHILQRSDGLVQIGEDIAYDSLEHAIDKFLERYKSKIHPIAPLPPQKPNRTSTPVEATNKSVGERPKLFKKNQTNSIASDRFSSSVDSVNSSASSMSLRMRSSPNLRIDQFDKATGSTPNGHSKRRMIIAPTSASNSAINNNPMQINMRLRRSGLSSSRLDLPSGKSHHRTGSSTGSSFVSFLNGQGMAHRSPTTSKRQLFDSRNLRDLINIGISSIRSRASMIPRIDSSQIQFGSQLGQGNFGKVYSGYYTDDNFMTYPVAIKVLRENFAGSQKKEFIQEASVMRQLLHPFIVRLYGIVNDRKNLWMVQELLPQGSLFELLSNSYVPQARLKSWIMQIIAGMQYMEASRYVHRDLAARNILLASQDQVKISDFGLSRYTGDSESYEYVQRSDCPIPFQWYAPEAFAEYHFTSKSDVWSFGVVVWEMFSNCQFPYAQVAQEPIQLLQYLQHGGRLDRPPSCPSTTWSLVSECWHLTPYKRPSFAALFANFSALADYNQTVAAVNRLLKWHR